MISIGFIVDPIETLNAKKDSTIDLFREATERGYPCRFADCASLAFSDGVVTAEWLTVELTDSVPWYRLIEKKRGNFDGVDVVLMRKDPPFDNEYLYATHLLDLLPSSAICFNRPAALRDHNEKLALLEFPEFAPETIVTADPRAVHRAIDRLGDVIIKPLDGMGGQGIFRLRGDDLNRQIIVTMATQAGRRHIMVQRYLPEIADGDKRVLVIDGKPIDYSLARMATEGETRANLAAGGRGVAMPLTDREREIALAVGAKLIERGLFLVGLDMIGGKLTEINVTSPTCFVEIHQQTGFSVRGCFWDRLSGYLKSGRLTTRRR